MTDNGNDGSAGNLAQIRASVRALCGKFPGEYWRRLDRERAYPSEFVKALTQAGFLAALIPEEYGGSGLTLIEAAAILEEIHACGGNGQADRSDARHGRLTGSGLRLAEHIRNSVVADAIAAAEIGVRVIVERAPTEAAGELRV